MKGIPMIKSVMTPFPYFIDMEDSLQKARDMMAQHNIRHLPVIDAGKLASVITEEDVARALENHGSSADALRVKDGCESEVYIVNLTERLDAVLLHMARTHIDCTLVVKHGHLVGVFTMRDACRCFGEWLRERFPHGNGHDAA